MGRCHQYLLVALIGLRGGLLDHLPAVGEKFDAELTVVVRGVAVEGLAPLDEQRTHVPCDLLAVALADLVVAAGAANVDGQSQDALRLRDTHLDGATVVSTTPVHAERVGEVAVLTAVVPLGELVQQFDERQNRLLQDDVERADRDHAGTSGSSHDFSSLSTCRGTTREQELVG